MTTNLIAQTSNLIVQANTNASNLTVGGFVAVIIGSLILAGLTIGFAHWLVNR